MQTANDARFEALKSRLQQDPDSLLFARVAEGLLMRDQVDEAIRICEEGTRKHPYYVTGHMVLGKCYLKKKLFDLAEKEFKRVILFDPKYLAAHKYYGDLMREVGWDNTCEMSYRKILAIDPLDENVSKMLESFESMKPREQEVVTTDYVPETEKVVGAAARPAVQERAKSQTATEPINLEDDLFAEVDEQEPAEPARSAPLDNDDENVITTILEDIFEEGEGTEKIAEESGAEESDEPDEFEDTIEGLNIKISPRQTSKKASPPQQQTEPEEPDQEFGGFDRYEEDTIEFNEVPDLGAETTEHMKSAEDFELEFVNESVEEQPGEEQDFDALIGEEESEQDFFEEVTHGDVDADVPLPEKTTRATAKPEEQELEEAEQPQSRPAPPSTESGTFEREKIVTPTLGEIYAAQGQYAKAINVFELLLKKDPGNKTYRERIAQLKKRMEESQDA